MVCSAKCLNWPIVTRARAPRHRNLAAAKSASGTPSVRGLFSEGDDTSMYGDLQELRSYIITRVRLWARWPWCSHASPCSRVHRGCLWVQVRAVQTDIAAIVYDAFGVH